MSTVGSLVTALFRPQRSIAGFTATVTIEEQARDELVITKHPVEYGADIADHAYKLPSQVIIRCAWSNSTLASIGATVLDLLSLLDPEDVVSPGTFNFAQDIYQQLLALQFERIPFDVVTGKRSYTNMLLRTIEQTTDEKTEHALYVTLGLEQVIIVQTGSVSLPPAANQATPQQTQAPSNTGVKQVVPGSPSPGGAAPPAGSSSSPAWGESLPTSATDFQNQGLL